MSIHNWAKPYKKILAALDGSDFGAQILPHAKLLASATNAKLILLEVVPEVEPIVEITGATGRFMHLMQDDHKAETAVEQRQKNLMKAAQQTLTPLVEMLRQQGIETQSDIEVGKPAEQILHYAKQNDIDLIMMSTHGRTGLAHLLLGSIAEKVLHAAECPVFLLRPDTD